MYCESKKINQPKERELKKCFKTPNKFGLFENNLVGIFLDEGTLRDKTGILRVGTGIYLSLSWNCLTFEFV